MTAEIRPAVPGDLPEILRLMRDELGWPDDERAEALWRWKHEQNPFGVSPVWVAAEREGIVALRAFLRWRMLMPDGTAVNAVRAVDTATDRRHRGQGWFRRLTLHALEAMQAEGVDFVFNTPNEQSRPGYLSMGWTEQKRPVVWLRPGSLARLPLLARSRTGADIWPAPCEVGLDTTEAFVGGAVPTRPDTRMGKGPAGPETDRSPEFYRWRYGLPSLGYRVATAPGGVGAGFAVFRARRRGPSVERVLLDHVGARSAVAGALAQPPSFDHALAVGRFPGPGWFPVPGLGPRLVARPLASALPNRLSLNLGDIELF